ncbi:hypothetical protein HZU83_20735 [Sphaerotilus montanus]|uniref:Uncharacterized protein n=1 Tax=Sphaerotilus montanus TaxID=522889 RepID=A0A7Y9UIE2_9BURK|nr:hypothetical protein [Sphaerotilus montanus]NYG31635.1 hypothetical protein [Sphaerotilus montanus]NZD59110.1 hypothetical protein [Sphaerotilus montanus]
MTVTHAPHPSATTMETPVIDQATQAATRTPPEPLNPCDLLETLFQRAALTMSADELQHVANQAGELAYDISDRAAGVAERLGCLVFTDKGDRANGAFQSADQLPGLLWHFSDVFRHVAGLVSVSGSAEAMARRARG